VLHYHGETECKSYQDERLCYFPHEPREAVSPCVLKSACHQMLSRGKSEFDFVATVDLRSERRHLGQRRHPTDCVNNAVDATPRFGAEAYNALSVAITNNCRNVHVDPVCANSRPNAVDHLNCRGCRLCHSE